MTSTPAGTGISQGYAGSPMAWQTPSIPFGKTIQYPQDQGGKIIGYTEQLPSPGMSGNLYSMIASLPWSSYPNAKTVGDIVAAGGQVPYSYGDPPWGNMTYNQYMNQALGGNTPSAGVSTVSPTGSGGWQAAATSAPTQASPSSAYPTVPWAQNIMGEGWGGTSQNQAQSSPPPQYTGSSGTPPSVSLSPGSGWGVQTRQTGWSY